MSEVHELYLCDLVELATVQPRATIHQPTVNQYAELYQERALMPPIRVVVVNESDDGEEKYDQFVVVDGFHRVAAARQAKLNTIMAEVTDGTMEQAKWEALSANRAHGRRPSLEDMDRMIELALESELGKNMTNELLGAHLGCSARTIIRAKHRLGQVRAYERSYDKAQDEDTQAAIKSLAKVFPDEIEQLRKGEITKSPEELQKFAALDRHHQRVLAPLFLSKNLSVDAAKDIADMRPSAEELPMAAFVDFAINSEEGSDTWHFRSEHVRVDITTVES
jgi:hypothetical protein